jgi:hypothetical protein
MRVLFLGNSQIICNCNLPQIVRKLSESSNAGIESQEVVIGGATIEKLWNDGRALAAIQNEKFDWVLCHEIVYSYGGNGARLREFGRKFHEEAQKTGARMIFYASGDVNNERRTHEAMYNDAAALASECGGRVAGGGMAWLKAWHLRPELDFHCSDRAHPSELGYYLNACVIFAAFSDRSPLGLDPYSLNKSDAEFLQNIAWEQYQDDRRKEKK